MGQSGALAMLFLLFLAVTSAVSTEQVAVSNILTYDIYAAYINPNPTEKQILWVSRVTIMAYCIVMGGISTGFFYIGVSMGYLYVLMVSPLDSIQRIYANNLGLYHWLRCSTRRLLRLLGSMQWQIRSRRCYHRLHHRYLWLARRYFRSQQWSDHRRDYFPGLSNVDW
jgi:Na+/proline symporter